MQHLHECPVCNQTALKQFISCKDFTVSGEQFDLDECLTCGFVFTNPRPTDSNLPGYYQSDTYISHTNKANTLVDRIYKVARTFTLRWKYQLVQTHSQIKAHSILDYGCGTGAFLGECQNHHMRVSGVEPDNNARQLATQATAATIQPSLERLEDRFDVITLWHVLEHVSALNETIEQLKDRLEQNGTMFIAVPNHRSSDAAHYGEHWAAYDVPRHLWHFTTNTMTRLMHKHGLNIVSTIPMLLDAYYVSMLSEKYKRGKSSLPHMARGVINGMKSNYAAKKTSEYSSLIYVVRK